MKKFLLTTILGFSAISNSYASETKSICTKEINPDALSAVLSYLRSDQFTQVNTILEEYCYDYSFIKEKARFPELVPSFHAITPKQLAFLEKDRNIRTHLEQNTLNQNLLQHWLTIHVMDPNFILNHNFEEVLKETVKNFPNGTYNTNDVRKHKINLKNRRDMLDYIVENKNYHISTTDIFGNKTLHYLVLTGESFYVKKLVKNFFTEFNLRNVDGFTPLHLMFAPKFVVDSYTENNGIKNMNNFVIDHLLENQFQWNNWKSISFFEFAEIMKDNNIDFYNKLKHKFPNLFKVNRFTNSPVENQIMRTSIEKEINYASKIEDKTKTTEDI